MVKVRFTSEVSVKNSRVYSEPVGLENATAEQAAAIRAIKPVLHAWLKTRIQENPDLANADLLIRGKYVETSHGLTVEFKVQSVVSVG